MVRAVIAALWPVLALTLAPAVAADPQILVPACGEGPVADPGECTPVPEDTSALGFPGIPGAFPGANPGLPPGPTPRNFPVVLGLGVTPFNVPSNLPLGPTPPSGFPFPG